jgi:phosphate-selective porin
MQPSRHDSALGALLTRLPVLALTVVITTSGARSADADDIRDRITINGFTNFEFERQLEKKGFGDPKGSFDADELGFAINVHASDRIRISSELDWEHGAASGLGRGSVNLEYGFLEYTLKDSLKLRVGKFLTPFGIFNEVHNISYSFLSVKLPSSTNKTGRVIKHSYLFYPRWTVGIAARGDGSVGDKDFNYDVLLGNGDTVTSGATSELNPFEVDDNGVKSVTARFRFEPTAHLRVGNSFYYDKITDKGYNRIVSDGLELEFNKGRVRVVSEAVLGWLRDTNGGTWKQLGWYVQGSYRLGHGISPFVRLEQVNPLDTPSDDGFDLVTGINYEFSKNLFLKAENNHFWGGSKSSLGTLPGSKYNEIKAAVSFGF